jgi:hypothetical protein
LSERQGGASLTFCSASLPAFDVIARFLDVIARTSDAQAGDPVLAIEHSSGTGAGCSAFAEHDGASTARCGAETISTRNESL